MKLYMVVYLMGLVGGYAGPLPYGYSECEYRADQMRANVAHYATLGHDANGNPLTDEAKTLKFACVYSAEKPQLDPRLDDEHVIKTILPR